MLHLDPTRSKTCIIFPSAILFLLLASILPHFCQCQHLDISSAYLKQLHDSKAKRVDVHRPDDTRNLQIQNPCAYVKLGELESTYRSATGVEFDCSCQALGFSNFGQTVCESKEAFCCSSSSNFDGDTADVECQTAKETATFSVVPFSGYWVPRPLTTTICMRFTGDDDRKDSEVCKTNEFTRDAAFDGSFTCEAKFDGSLCGDCAQCDGSDGGAYDCSNVARSSNFQVSCEDRSDSQRTCRAQSGAEGIATESPTESPSKSPTSLAPTIRPTPAPVQKDIPSTSTSAKENSPATKPTQSDSQLDGNNADEIDGTEPESHKNVKGPQSLLCTNGSCILSDEDAAQQCNFYALSKYGDANFNSNGKAVVESINTSEGPIDIEEGCVMKCKGCYLVLSPDDASPSSAGNGFTTKLWSIGNIIASLAIIGMF